MKIGIGITTFERVDRFKKCFQSLMNHSRDVQEIVIVDDCSVKDREAYDDFFKQITMLTHIKVFVQESNVGVGKCKNKILKYFFDKGYDYVFTIEDDMLILSNDTFKQYIEVSQKSGIEYLNFALHGPANKGLLIKEFDGVAFYPHCVGSFSLHSKRLIDAIGFYDENFFNAWEHVDYYYQASLKELTTPFGLFADIKDSDKYVDEQENSINDGRIRLNERWEENVTEGRKYFLKKNGKDVISLLHEGGFV